MKKKIISILAVSMLFGSVVSAASIWGTYKGNQVIRITSNGNTLRTDDVPAISYNGRTMIPISMLGQIGVQYKWDQKNQTVNIEENTNNSGGSLDVQRKAATVANIYKELLDVGHLIMGAEDVFIVESIVESDGQRTLTRLNTAINEYNELVNRSDVKKLIPLYPNINTVLTYYYSCIETLKEMTSLSNKTIDKMQDLDSKFDQSYQLATMLAESSYKEFIDRVIK